jgi:hypothetical protein
LALALIPLLWAALRVTALMVPSVAAEGLARWGLYVAGALVYLLFERIVSRPMMIYVFSHELTHAISGFLSGARIHSFKATSKGGEVRLSKSNLFVALSPYIVPLYALFILLVYALVRIWYQNSPSIYVFQFLLGLTLAFHLSMTASAIHLKQPDLKIMGIFLSVVLIAIANTLILGVFCVSLFKKTPSIRVYGARLGGETVRAWRWTVRTGWTAGQTIYKELEQRNKPH